VPAGNHIEEHSMFSAPLTRDASLRPLEPWRAQEFLTHLDRARDHIAPWVGQSFLATDLASARAVLQRYADSQARDSGGLFGIWLDDTLVGGVMFVSLDAAAGVCEVGCWLEPGAVGRGLITRAVQRLIDWAVRVRGINRVEWQTLSGNDPSIRVAQRLGMRRDGVLREAVAPRPSSANRQDLEIWSVLAAEWLARPETP
jgi:RimJ/RimL family protein N-acetyltransferase